MTASDLILRARSISDLPNSKFVSHTDELSSLNESYRDVYSAILESDDDYYVNEQAYTLTSANAVANTTNEFTLTLPTDFYKVRYLDFKDGSDWWPVKKFPISAKDRNPGIPYYRLKNSTLWITGGNTTSANVSIRLGYSPPPVTLTAPDTDLQYGTAILPNNFSLVSSPGYMATAAGIDYGFYDYNVQNITAGSIKNGTMTAPVTLLAVGANISNLVYYKGYMYWLQAADIYRGPTDLVSTITPTKLTTTADVTSFAIYNDLIYFSPGAAIKTCTLSGGSISAALVAAAGVGMSYCHGSLFYVTAAGALKSVTPAATLFASAIADCRTDGTYLYILDTSNNLRRITLATPTAWTVGADETIATDVKTLGPVFGGRIPFLTKEGQTYLARDVSVNYSFTFPANIVTEIIAYQMAIDFRSKKEADTAELKARLGRRAGDDGQATGLWARFEREVKRDEYSPERIRNYYADNTFGRG